MKIKLNFLLVTTFVLIMTLISVSCRKSEEAVISYNDSVMFEGEFRYWLSTYKYIFTQSFENYDESAGFYAQTTADGTTYEKMLTETALHNMKISVISRDIFDEYGFELSNDAVNKIDDYIDSLINNYADGDKTALNKALSEFGVNYKMLRQIYLNDAMAAELSDRLYGDDGEIGIADADREEYLLENYVHFRHIYINDKYKLETDKDGNFVKESDGNVNKLDLTEEELSSKKEIVEKISKALEDGTDFKDLYEEYSEDRYYDEEGYYLRADSDFIYEVTAAAFSLEDDAYTMVKSDHGTHFILREESKPDAYADKTNEDFFKDYDSDVSSWLLENLINERIGDVKVNENIAAEYSITEVPINKSY